MSQEIRRDRIFPHQEVVGRRWDVDRKTGTIKSVVETPIQPVGSQTTWSTDTSFPQREAQKRRARARGRVSSLERSKLDVGGPFTTVLREYSDNGCLNRPVNAFKSWIGVDYRYSGPILGLNPELEMYYPSYSDLDLRNEMIQKGTTAIARTIPTNPVVGVGNLIGESVQRIPTLPGAAILGKSGNVAKKFSDEYLNYEFGLKPLLSDVDGIVSTVRNTNRILEQLKRDSGRLIRRRYEFPLERTRELIDSGTGYSYPILQTAQYNGQGKWTVYREITKRFWFSGAYTYYFDQGQDLWAKLKRAEQKGNRLFGLRLSPSLAWELAPWSWAADWVSNAGDVMTNLSAFSRDGLVLRWGYMMCTMRIRDTHVRDVHLDGEGTFTPVQYFTTTVKKRVRATPYGFGLDPDWKDFSSRQLAILGALGINRVA